MNFKNKVVIVTGASSGIGLALAHQFAAQGSNLVLGARNKAALTQLSAQLKQQYSVNALAVQCDVALEADCANLVQQATATFGSVDVLINNAGMSMRALFNDTDLGVLKRLMDVNFWGTVYCTKYALPQILKTKGSIVGVSSIAGYKGLPGRSGYSASKFAMNGFLDSLRVETLKSGVNVLTACPGFTASNIRNTALASDGSAQGESTLEEAKMMSADEVATHIVNAIAKRKRTLILTGQGKLTVLLSKLLPGVLDGLVYNVFAKEKNPLLK